MYAYEEQCTVLESAAATCMQLGTDCQLIVQQQMFTSTTYQKGMIGSTTSSTIPVLWRISHTLTNSHGATKIEQLEVIQHVARQIPDQT